LAAENGHSEVVSILLSKSTLQLHVKDKMGRTAMHLAAANGHRELISQLIGQGADINAPDEVGCHLFISPRVFPPLPEIERLRINGNSQHSDLSIPAESFSSDSKELVRKSNAKHTFH